MADPTYIVKDPSGVYYFRYNFPQWARLKDRTLPKSIKLSLKTRQKTVAFYRAKSLWLKAWMEMQRQRGNLLLGNDNHTPITTLLKRYRDYIANAEQFVQEAVLFGTPEFEQIVDHVQDQLIDINQLELLGFLDSDNFSNLDELHEKAQVTFQAKRSNDIDNKLAGKTGVVRAVPVQQNVEVPVIKGSVILSELFTAYAAKKKIDTAWTSKSYHTNRRRFELLIETVGDINSHEFTKAHVRQFIDRLLTQTVVRNDVAKPLSKTTLNQSLETCNAVFRFGKNRYDEITENYFDNSDLKFKVNKQDKSKRLPWTKGDLGKMFSHSIFQTGKGMSNPYYYWLPILGLCTGARLNELSQLHIGDIRELDGINYLSINMEQDEKSIKNKKPRDVPIHQCLIDLGFLDMIKYMKQKPYKFVDDTGYQRLWRGIAYDAKDGSYKKHSSAWFNKGDKNAKGEKKGFKYQHGITFNEGELKDFHSFRHTFSTVVGQQGMDRATSHQLTGHSLDEIKRSVGDGYNHGKTLAMLNDAVQKINFKQYLSNVKPFFEVINLNILREKAKGKR